MDHRRYDVVIIGAGGAGMVAALVCAVKGLRPLLIEKSAFIGGTTALSAGSVWIPNTHLAPEGKDSFENALTYLEAIVGERSPLALKRTFLRFGPEAIRFLEENTQVRFRAYAYHPDYFSDAPGAVLAGRALEPVPFDGRVLGSDFARLRPPMPEFTLLGGMMVDRTDIAHLLKAGRSVISMRHAMRLVVRYAFDRLRHPRGTRLVMGNALAGRLFASLQERHVPIWTSTSVDRVLKLEDAVSGVRATRGETSEVVQTQAVIIATGGFTHHPIYRRAFIGDPIPDWSPVIPENAGNGLDLAVAAGGRIGTDHDDGAFWAPVSVRKRADGTIAVFPHFVLDRGKPGLVAVDRSGQRFVNEASPYHIFGRAMRAAGAAPYFFICDRDFIWKYGLGMIRPGTLRLKPFLEDGYLMEAESIASLAIKLGIDQDRLAQTIADNNRFAEIGKDIAFGKGDRAYGRNLGDASHGPNPCIGPISSSPFYGIRVYPGDIGASRGIVTDDVARVLGADGEPIKGLFACGNDMHSVMGGAYPGPGITLGPAMTFAYLAARQVQMECRSTSANLA